MTMAAWELFRPTSALAAFGREMGRLMDGFFGLWFPRLRPVELAVVFPEIEMYGRQDEVVVKAEVPGLE
jgi:hypothetical protein